jgi:sec-independent protein translocase protein TatC
MTENTGGEMPFLAHLEELRWRLIKAIAAVVAGAIPCGILWRRIFDLLMVYPLRIAEPKPKIIFTAPAEGVLLSIKIAVAGGIILGVPVISYQIWKFVAPGLYRNEKRIVIPVVIVSSLCFFAGAAFSYILLPYVLRFLAAYASGALEPYFRANEYIGFLLKIVLAFGLVFELPVISFVLTKMDVITAGFLIKKFKYAFVIFFILAALITPPDVISQLFLAGPLLVLYGISILVAFMVQRRKRA